MDTNKRPWNVNKNAWHVKLMKFIWGLDYTDFSWLCVYFWLSTFNVLFIIPILIVKLVIFLLVLGIRGVVSTTESISDRKAIAEREEFKSYLNMLEDASLAITPQYNLSLLLSWKYDKAESFFDYASELNRDLYQKINKIYTAEIQRLSSERYQEKRERQANKQYRINNILKFAKPAALVILWIIGLAAIFFAGFGSVKLYQYLCTLSGGDWGKFFSSLLIALGLFAGLIVIIILLAFVVSKTSKKGASALGAGIASPFVFIARSIAGFFVLIGHSISDNCPAINWVEKTDQVV